MFRIGTQTRRGCGWFVLLALYDWSVAMRRALRLPPEPANLLLGALAFGWANAVLFRALHHIAGLPYTLDGMLSSVLAQSALSDFWTSMALLLTLLAVRVGVRAVWAAEAVLLGAVVVKLFAVDLSNTGTVGRIVSFVVVGLLLLVIGYVAPVPPRSRLPGGQPMSAHAVPAAAPGAAGEVFVFEEQR